MNSTNVRRLLWVRGLRAFGDGYVSLLLPIYLLSLGLTPFEVGVIATGTLLGSGVLTLLVGLHAYRFRYRVLLLGAAALMTLTGLGFAAFTAFWPLLVVAIVGTLNPSSGDVSVFLPLEHSIWPEWWAIGSVPLFSRDIAWSAHSWEPSGRYSRGYRTSSPSRSMEA